MSHRHHIVLTAAGLALGCAPASSIGSTAASSVETAPVETVYEFVEHGPAVDSAQPAKSLSCTRSCLATWEPALASCGGFGAAACNAGAAETVSKCLETDCYELPTTTAPACAVSCAAESAVSLRDCTGAGCAAEADDVYEVCFDATCRDGQVARRITERVASAIRRTKPEEPEAAESAGGFDCHEACVAFEVSLYLRCVADHPSDPAACRDREQFGYDECVNEHCPAP